jgi:hypothetical protein
VINTEVSDPEFMKIYEPACKGIIREADEDEAKCRDESQDSR